MEIRFPFVYNGTKYSQSEFLDSFVCAECGGRLTSSDGEAFCFEDDNHKGIKLVSEEMKMDKMPVKLDEITTLTGIKIVDAIAKMNERLDDAAYKEYNPTKGFTLTDISPAYLLEKLNEIFGPSGLGWRYEFEPLFVDCQEVGSSFLVSVIGFKFYYTLVWDGESHEIGPILSTGGSKNNKKEYALKGAITNALGTAAYRGLNWQLDVYKGQRTHLGDVDVTPAQEKLSIDFIGAASLHTNIEKMKEIAKSNSPLAPSVQLQLLKSIDENSLLSKLPDMVTKPVSDAIKKSLGQLLKMAKLEFAFAEELLEKKSEEMTIMDFRLLWTTLTMIANGEKKDDVVKRMKEFKSG